MITAERVTAFLMKYILRISLLLMLIGIISSTLKTNQATGETLIQRELMKIGLPMPDSALFFNAATVLLLITPIIVSFCAGLIFTVKKQFKMASVSFLLFAILGASVAINMFIAA
ncbi:MAG: hypothetical protein LBH05_06240 [Deferribacteraceae bacterium]|jgi:hypothetical protein|nr:hypothetical protein [Deferribacteraceae bacterium]